jgi:hypothetical protein
MHNSKVITLPQIVKLLVIQKFITFFMDHRHSVAATQCVVSDAVLQNESTPTARGAKSYSLQAHVMNKCSSVRIFSRLIDAAGMSLYPTLLLRLSFPGLSCIRCFPHKSSLIVLGPKLVFNERLRSSMQVTTFEPRQNPHARFMIYDRRLDDVTRVSPAFFPNKVNKLLIYSSKNVLLLSLTGAH